MEVQQALEECGRSRLVPVRERYGGAKESCQGKVILQLWG